MAQATSIEVDPFCPRSSAFSLVSDASSRILHDALCRFLFGSRSPLMRSQFTGTPVRAASEPFRTRIGLWLLRFLLVSTAPSLLARLTAWQTVRRVSQACMQSCCWFCRLLLQNDIGTAALSHSLSAVRAPTNRGCSCEWPSPRCHINRPLSQSLLQSRPYPSLQRSSNTHGPYHMHPASTRSSCLAFSSTPCTLGLGKPNDTRLHLLFDHVQPKVSGVG